MREREEVFDHFITAVINTDDEPEHTPRFFRHP